MGRPPCHSCDEGFYQMACTACGQCPDGGAGILQKRIDLALRILDEARDTETNPYTIHSFIHKAYEKSLREALTGIRCQK